MRIILAYITALITASAASGQIPAETAKADYVVRQNLPASDNEEDRTIRSFRYGQPADTLPEKPARSFRMGLKTNMLYDTALVPNISAEFYLGANISAYGDWMYAWWHSDSHHRYWRIYGGDIGLRWWFGHKYEQRPLSGHHLGIYGGILTFDFELGEYGYMGGKPKGTLWDRYLVNAGIEYGFSLPVAKRLNIDFSIGLGYLGGRYIKYYPFDNDYYFDKEYDMHYFGPTKAEVSLVWLIGNGISRKKKGGEE